MRQFRAVVFLLLVAVPALAQDADPPLEGPPPPSPPSMIARDTTGRITIRAMHVPSPFVLDSVLEEPFYRDVPPFGDFI